MQDVDNKGKMGRGTDGIWELFVLHAQFFCKSKIVLQIVY